MTSTYNDIRAAIEGRIATELANSAGVSGQLSEHPIHAT
jgi:hypothetical protein